MGISLGELLATLSLDNADFEKRIKESESSSARLQQTVERAGEGVKEAFVGMAGAVGLYFGAFKMAESIADTFSAHQSAVVLLDNTYRHARESIGLTRGELDSISESILKTTRFSHDSAIQAEAMLASFHNIRGDIFKQALASAADFATKMQIDLPQATQTLARALEQPANGFMAMQRAKIIFSAAEKDTIKNLAETGHVAEAQALMLRKLQDTIGALAQESLHSFGGQLDSIKNQTEATLVELTDSIANSLGANTTGFAQPVIDGVHSIAGAIAEMVADSAPLLKQLKGMIEDAFSGTELHFATLQQVIQVIVAFEANAVSMIAGLAAIGTKFTLLGLLKPELQDQFAALSKKAETLRDNLFDAAGAGRTLAQQLNQVKQVTDDKPGSGAPFNGGGPSEEALRKAREIHEKAVQYIADLQSQIALQNDIASINARDDLSLVQKKNAVERVTEQYKLQDEFRKKSVGFNQADRESAKLYADRAASLKAENDAYAKIPALAKQAADEVAKIGKNTPLFDMSEVKQKFERIKEKMQLDLEIDFNMSARADQLRESLKPYQQVMDEVLQRQLGELIVLHGKQLLSDEEYHRLTLRAHMQFWEEMIGATEQSMQIISEAFGGTQTTMGSLFAAASKFASAVRQMGQGGQAMIDGIVGAVGAIGSMLKTLNVGGAGKGGGISSFGGAMEGNYAGPGSMVGTVIGGIIGTYFGATQAGMAIGGAIGTVVGSLISKGADSASARLLSGGIVSVEESSRKLNGAVAETLNKIFSGLSQGLAALGLNMGGLPLIDVKIRDNVVRVVVGAVTRTFQSLQDAVSFGITEAIKQTATTGSHLPQEVLDALSHTKAADLQQLNDDINFAMSIANYGVPQVVQALNKSVSDFFVAMERAGELGISSTKIIQQFADNVAAEKDQILGITRNMSPADKMRADAAAFNQRVDLMRAEKAADLISLQAKKADLEGQVAIARASMELDKGRLQVDEQMVMAQQEALATLVASLAAVDQAIAATQAVIDSLVKISDEELNNALRNIGKGTRGAGGQSKSDIEQWLKDRKSAELPNFQKQLYDLDKAFADEIKAAGKNKELVKELTDERKKETKALGDQIRAQLVTPYTGRAGQRSQFASQLDEITKAYADAEKVARKTGVAVWQLNAAEKERLHQLGLEAMASAGSKAAQTALDMQQLAQTIDFVRMHAKELGVDFGSFIAEVQGAQFVQLGDELVGFLQKYYGQSKDFDQMRMAVEQVRFTLDLNNMRLQFTLLKAQGALTQQAIDVITKGLGYIDSHPVDWDKVINGFDNKTSDTASSFSGSVSDFTSAVRDFAKFTDSLLLDQQLTTLDPRQQIAEATRQFQAALASAQGNRSADTLQALEAAERTILQLQRSFSGSGDDYQNLFDYIINVNRALEGGGGYNPSANGVTYGTFGASGGGSGVPGGASVSAPAAASAVGPTGAQVQALVQELGELILELRRVNASAVWQRTA